MTIGIEAERANAAQKTGVEHYAKQLICHLAQIDPLSRYILYLRTAPQPWLRSLPANFEIKVLPFPLFWTQLRLSYELWRHPVNVLLVPASALPLVHPRRSVVTVHDVGWRYFPQSFTWFTRHFLEWSTGYACRHAAKIIAVSEATKRDLEKFYRVDPVKIMVVHHGFGLNAPSNIQKKLPEKYVIFLSTLQPRKNLEGLLAAFRQLKAERPELPHKLVIAGKPGWKFGNILKLIGQNTDIAVYVNHVSEEDKAAMLAGADALVQPSFYEGFGMQILEAFAAGVPVACSNVSSLPEVAGEAAAYFDPRDVGDMKRAIQNILTDRSLADRLRAKGRERLKEFGWEKCARETLAVLQNE